MRYIDADKIPRHGKRGGECYWQEIEQLQTADVVEAVRCDQCRHFDAINNDDHGWCKLISDLPIGVSVRYHDDYCSYGEREDT